MEIPTFNCTIEGETTAAYLVKIKCSCGKVHHHGAPKSSMNDFIGKPDHRIAHCGEPIKKGPCFSKSMNH